MFAVCSIVALVLVIASLLTFRFSGDGHSFIRNAYAVRLDENNCKPAKILVVDVENSGLGNKILATVSASILAYSLNRVLNLKWIKSEKFDASYLDLFKPQEEFAGKDPSPFLYSSNNIGDSLTAVQSAASTLSVCTLSLDGSDSYSQFSLLQSSYLLTKMDNECDEIYLKSNHYFGEILTTFWYGGDYVKNKKTFPSPYENVVQRLFVPRNSVLKQAKKFVENLRGKSWLSIHARGYYDENGNWS